MTRQKIILSLLLTCSMGMVKAQTVEIAPNGVPATHNEVLCTGGSVTFTFDGANVKATTDYGAKTEFTSSETATAFTFGETAVDTVQLRKPSGFDYAVGSHVASANLDFTGVKGNSTIGTVIRPYTATGCTTSAITLEGQTVINSGSAYVMSGDSGWFCVPVTASSASYTTNKFQGSTTQSVTSDATQYALSSEGTFKKVQSGVVIPIKRAYFIPESASAAAKAISLFLDFDGNATTIQSIETDTDTPTDGIYLKGGQFFIIRDGVKYSINGTIIK